MPGLKFQKVFVLSTLDLGLSLLLFRYWLTLINTQQNITYQLMN